MPFVPFVARPGAPFGSRSDRSGRRRRDALGYIGLCFGRWQVTPRLLSMESATPRWDESAAISRKSGSSAKASFGDWGTRTGGRGVINKINQTTLGSHISWLTFEPLPSSSTSLSSQPAFKPTGRGSPRTVGLRLTRAARRLCAAQLGAERRRRKISYS